MSIAVKEELLNYWEITTKQDLIAVTRDLDQYAKLFGEDERPIIGFDLEYKWTDPSYKLGKDKDYVMRPYPMLNGDLEGRARLIQIGLDPFKTEARQYVIDVDAVGDDLVKEYLTHYLTTFTLLGHALQGDIQFLVAQFGIIPESIIDTVVVSRYLHAGNTTKRHSLGDAYDNFFDQKLYHWFQEITGMTFVEFKDRKKTMQKSNWGEPILSKEQKDYAAEDVCPLLWHLYRCQVDYIQNFMKKHKKQGILRNLKVAFDTVIEVALSELAGMGFDISYYEEEVEPLLRDAIDEIEAELVRIPELWLEFEVEKCPKKNPHTIKWMQFANLGSPSRMDKKKGYVKGQLERALNNLGIEIANCQEESLQELVSIGDLTDFQRDVLSKIMNYREAKSLLSKFGLEKMAKYIYEGRLHCHWNPSGTVTFRFSSNDPNMQQYPSKGNIFGREELKASRVFRRAVVARPEHKLVIADFSNQEMRVTMDYAGDIRGLQMFAEDVDFHAETAKECLGLNYLPEDGSLERSVGKETRLSRNYRAGVIKVIRKIAVNTKFKRILKPEEGQVIINRLTEMHPEVEEMFQACYDKVAKALNKHESLTAFYPNKEIFVGFSPQELHRVWVLTDEQKKMCLKIFNGEKPDIYHRDYLIEGKRGPTTFGNEFNSMIHRIAREYFNFRVQGDSALILKMTIVDAGKNLVQAGFDRLRERLIAFIHDELIGECKGEKSQKMHDIIVKSMYDNMRKVVKKVRIEISSHISDTWSVK